MRRAALLAPALLLAACGGEAEPAVETTGAAAATTSEAPVLDGTQTYRTAQELVDAMDAAEIPCTGLESENGSLAIAQARCDVYGQEVVLQLWGSSAQRDNGVTQLTGVLDSADIYYCYVVGRGATGTWTVNAPNNPTCDRVEDALGGDRLSSD
ncbi:hypothetical protein TEK04_19660 [Klenkia sp. LSe6-5]|uniref:DUF3558 domain-containing protein n=1 Tax=Klenkia sesuvii TaxID=3103137 RepID=A0ABU8DYM9_9ACTN